ncbi:MAG: cellulase family glycosylhydrolase [Candidatus Sumerlaeota bacterium]|nr:cellulase family glycosylhydrolase [Candidatus Sumerlaeota bacterium]
MGQVAEFALPAPTNADNPYDPAVAALDAEFLAPSGKRIVTSGFFMIPQKPVTEPPKAPIVARLRIYFSAQELPAGGPVELLFDDVRLVDSGKRESVLVDDCESDPSWKSQGAEIAAETGQAHSGRQSLRVAVQKSEGKSWPGFDRTIANEDWSRFDELRFWLYPATALRPNTLGVECYTIDGQKIQKSVDLGLFRTGEWKEVVWRLPIPQETQRFEPAGAPQWRARLMPQEAGAWKARFTYRDNTGEKAWDLPFNVAEGQTDGFVRVSPRDKRYLEFDSGKPFFPVGMNLLGKDLVLYRRYVEPLARNGGNYVRIWLSMNNLGFELEPSRYAQDRAAQLDALFDYFRERGVYTMVCLNDFREVGTFGQGSYWDKSVFNAAVGGPCARPEDVFTNPAAIQLYERKLRYAVARWGASPAVMAWEFFNEFNYTEAWKANPQAARDWHAKMGACLRSIDPYGHLITSSFSGLEDDALWTLPVMDIVQRHFYLQAGRSFTDYATAAIAFLAPHGKPALIGEFGRKKNEHADADATGVSLHDGLWASALSGGCGAAATWWWQWLEQYNLWSQFARLQEFLQGVDWPAEQFAALEADLAAQPDPKNGFGPLRIAPVKGSFKPAPFNQPVEVALGSDGKPDHPELLAAHLHGLRNHKEYHNPVTFHADYERAGEFAVFVTQVSQSGGAGLTISIDGEPRLQKDFPLDPKDPAAAVKTTAEYAGRYAVPVAPGRHAIRVENTGKDWLVVGHYELEGVRARPPLRLVGLRGRTTALVWLRNTANPWDKAILSQPDVTLRNVSATLRGLPAGRWRIRPFDPWTGQWGAASEAAVAADGRLALSAGELATDAAWRLERK